MAQERYLSPKEILSYLCDLENKLPKRDYKIYVESHRHDDDFGRVTPQEMNEECHKIYHMLTISSLTRPEWDAEVLVKYEGLNIGGSIRVSIFMQ